MTKNVSKATAKMVKQKLRQGYANGFRLYYSSSIYVYFMRACNCIRSIHTVLIVMTFQDKPVLFFLLANLAQRASIPDGAQNAN